MRPDWIACASASSSTRPPRAQLMRRAPGLRRASSASPRRCRVSAVRGEWIVMKSARLDHGARHLGGAADDEPLVLADAGGELTLGERAGHLDVEAVLAERVDADGLEAVGDENPLHDFSTKIFCAARTLEPKSTGCPRSASTCSSADRATMTSNSAA